VSLRACSSAQLPENARQRKWGESLPRKARKRQGAVWNLSSRIVCRTRAPCGEGKIHPRSSSPRHRRHRRRCSIVGPSWTSNSAGRPEGRGTTTRGCPSRRLFPSGLQQTAAAELVGAQRSTMSSTVSQRVSTLHLHVGRFVALRAKSKWGLSIAVTSILLLNHYFVF
jgi:hypothetical protein